MKLRLNCLMVFALKEIKGLQRRGLDVEEFRLEKGLDR